MARELVNAIQQLRKSAGLDLHDVVEVFFEEEGHDIEKAVSMNLEMYMAKFKGALPLPKSCAAPWAVELQTETSEIGGNEIIVSICRPCLSVRDDLEEPLKKTLSTFEPEALNGDGIFKCNVDGKDYVLSEGSDYWKNAAEKVKATKMLDWF
jgi:hypothetical protein